MADFVKKHAARIAPSRAACLAVLALAVALGVPQRAAASCGDYVMVGGSHGQFHQRELPQHEHRQAAAQPTPNESRSPARPGCHGPHCQKRGPLPLSPERGASESTGPHWADWRAIEHLTALDGRQLRLETSIRLPDVYSSPLWRPPTQA
ncbi:MAG TPA: hypothetical protein VF306_04730 [Pirellulales bacterium]